jgi:hypothetical protein
MRVKHRQSVSGLWALTSAAVLLTGACGAAPDDDEEPESPASLAPAPTAEKRHSGCGGENQPCCPDFTCAKSNLTCAGEQPADQVGGIPDPAELRCVPCGKRDQFCCGARSTAPDQFSAIRKPRVDRCRQGGTVCPEAEFTDLCTTCGGEFQPCCLKGKSCRGSNTVCRGDLCQCGSLGLPCCRTSVPGGCFEGGKCGRDKICQPV